MKKLLSKSILFALVLLFSTPGYAQPTQFNELAQYQLQIPGQDQVLTITKQKVSFVAAIQKLEQLTGLSFIYSQDKINLNKKVWLKADQQPLNAVLDELCGQVGVSYHLRSNKIILSAENEYSHISALFPFSGQVLDGDSGLPLPGVNIRVKGTDRGTTTDSEGTFSFNDLSEGDLLVFSFIGYQDKVVRIQDSEEITVRLYPQASELSEVVVTALNIDRERTRLGYSIQSVNGTDLDNSSETNVVNALSGKVSGIKVTSAGGGIGSSSRIVIRGENSITGQNQPLFVIDGVPVDNSNIKSGTGSFRPDAGGSKSAIDYGNTISDLNPNDIESISVLKGPNAAALYGSRAANGVVLIKTKTGQGAEGIGVTVESGVSFQQPMILPDYQNEYGQGVGDNFEFVDGRNGVNDGSDISFGPPLDEGLEFVQFNSNGEPAPWISHPDNVKDFFETGTKYSNNIAITGGGEQADFRLSFTNTEETGMVPNTDLGRNNISLNAGTQLTDQFNARASVNYVKTSSGNRMGGGYDDQNVMKQFLWFGRQVDIPALKAEYQDHGNEVNWNTNYHNNPYFIVNENTNALDRDRLFGNISLSYNVTEWLTAQAKAGIDFFNDVRTIKRAYNGIEFPEGAFTEDVYKMSEQNYEFLLRGEQNISEDFSLDFSAGGNWMKHTMRQNLVQARQLAVPGVYNVGNAKGIPLAQNRYEEKQIYSVYGLSELGFRDYLFLEVTARNDWSSTLPSDNNSYFYPSVSLSGVLTEMFDISDNVLDYAKLRASYAEVGSDTDPYQLNQVYSTAVSNWGAITTASESNTIPNKDLKPQITTSYEIGADLRFLDGKLAFDVTWYDMYTKNQIVSSGISSSSGYKSQIFNAGKIQNRGIEASAFIQPLNASSPFQWDLTVNYARNRNEVLELAEGVDRLRLPSGRLFRLDVVAVEGEPFGSFYGRGMRRTEDGEIIFKSNGLPDLYDEGQIQGNYQPDWTGGISNTFSYDGLSLNVLIDGSIGGEIYSGTNVIGRRAGVLASTLEGRENGIVGDGVVENPDGSYSPNTTNVSASSWYLGYYGYHNTEVSIFDASYIKLREVTLSYNLPYRWLQNLPIKSADVSVTGRNLLLLHSNAPNIDPETAIANDIAQGLEFGQIPSARSVGFNISLSL
ncbi:SusC/RagA family TonB-linked outer membrane protein [Halalkalibaculum sp. DA384]|uniref:SusC/RagA family TonB-linked outer membrane protein n=1 Tax=Halalkalibaculum sp. DA384 TaxID=3373606 RepID=UPI0037546B9C